MKKRKRIFTFATFPVENKIVFVRVDYNVPLAEAKTRHKRKSSIKVKENTKIKASLPTIKYLLQKNCTIILATHLGRPEGKYVQELKVDPLAEELKKLLPNEKITKLPDCIGKEIQEKIANAKPKQIFLLENLRFYKEEEQNNPAFAHSLASLADVYVNDAFAVSHRKHASVHAITQFLPALPGINMEKEITYLQKALHPQKPAVWIMGGAKLNKIDLLNQALKKADYILIGGALAFAFLKAQNYSIGMSKTDLQSMATAKKMLKKRNVKKRIILPLDFVVADSFSQRAKTRIVRYNQITNHDIGLDVGPATIELFKHYLRKAHTIVWNGPLGYFEWAQFAVATKEIGRFLGQLTATTICGGGETAEAITKFHLEHKITHLSTGGGATLDFLSGKTLPGIWTLEKNYTKYRKKTFV